MKINKSYLQQIIKEEYEKILKEAPGWLMRKRKKQLKLLADEFDSKVTIKDIQQALMAAAKEYKTILSKNSTIKPDDGQYGRATYKAIQKFQQNNPSDKYGADGLVGGYTAVQLRARAPQSEFAKKTEEIGDDIDVSAHGHKILKRDKGTGKSGKGVKSTTYVQLSQKDLTTLGVKGSDVDIKMAKEIIKILGGVAKVAPWRVKGDPRPIESRDIMAAAKKQGKEKKIQSMMAKLGKARAIEKNSKKARLTRAKSVFDALAKQWAVELTPEQKKRYHFASKGIKSWYLKHGAAAVLDWVISGDDSRESFGQERARAIIARGKKRYSN
jgi:hypothetical protein